MLKVLIRVAIAFLAAVPAWAQSGLADASLEQLLNTHVTSVSKKDEKLARTAAAVFVISQDDIRRSGMETIPDLLRMVPGVEVAQINASTWAVSIRGFNQHYANKLLVMIDGRSLYSPTFAGVYWDQVDLPLADIERIEVIRGPGASVWGANAVNGVINIITKSSKTTKGGRVEVTGNSVAGGGGSLDYGGDAGHGASYRGFASGARFGSRHLPDASDGRDAWARTRLGFRTDWDITANDSLVLEGNAFANRVSALEFNGFLGLPTDVAHLQGLDAAGSGVLARWNHSSASGAETSVQAYYDHFRRNEGGVPESQTAIDVDFQRHSTVGGNDIVWGAGYRALTENLSPGYWIRLNPTVRTDSLYSAFVQDEIRLINHLWLTLGSKLEHTEDSGFQFEPNARLAWAPTTSQTFWASASRALRLPSHVETSVDVNLGTVPLAPGLIQTFPLHGTPQARPEELRDFEVGYRAQITKRVSIDADSFLSYYKHLTSYEVLAPVFVPGIITELQIPLTSANRSRAIDYGGEVSVNCIPNSRWRMSGGYSLLFMNVSLDPGSVDPFAINAVRYAPHNTIQVRSTINLTRRLEWNQAVYWSGGSLNRLIPASTRVDARLAWKLGESVELSLNGQNLLRPGTLEVGNFEELVGTAAPRSLSGKISWVF